MYLNNDYCLYEFKVVNKDFQHFPVLEMGQCYHSLSVYTVRCSGGSGHLLQNL